MKLGWARALLIAWVAVAACGKKTALTGTGGGDAGPEGPTHLVAKWTFTGMPASVATCAAHMGTQVYVNLSGTIDPSLHQTVTADCSKGDVDLGSPLVQDLGAPYLEATLLDDMGKQITIVGVNVTPVVGSTTVTLDFFPAMGAGGMGGAGGASSSVASSTAAGTGGGGGMGGGSASSSSAGAGGGDAGADAE